MGQRNIVALNMGGRRKRNDFPFKQIEAIREEVKVAYQYYEKDIKWLPNKTRESPFYERLMDLMKEKAKLTVSYSTMVHFFTDEAVVDEEGELVLPMELYTQQAFKTFVDCYRLEAGISSKTQFIEKDIPLNATTLDIGLKKLLHNTYVRSKAYISSEEYIRIQEDGSAIHTFIQKLEAITDITHFMREYRIFNGGTLELLEAFNTETSKSLFFYSHNEQPDYKSFFIVFDDLIRAGNSITIQWTTNVQNFCDEVVQRKISHVDRRPSPVLIYKEIREHYIVPDLPLFKNLRVFIKRHPNPDMFGIEITPEFHDGFKHYFISHGDLTIFNVEIEIILDNSGLKLKSNQKSFM